MAAYPDDFSDWRFVWEQSFLDHFADNDYPARELDVFVVQIAAITEGVSISGEKTSVGPDDEKARRGLNAIVNSLAFHLVTERLETNLSRVAFHQLRVMQCLAVSDVAAVLVFS